MTRTHALALAAPAPELDHEIHVRAVRRAVWGVARPRTTDRPQLSAADDRARDTATQEHR